MRRRGHEQAPSGEAARNTPPHESLSNPAGSSPPVIVTLFSGGLGHVSAFAGIATVPVAAWEFSLGVWLVVKGFKPCPITAEMPAADTAPVQSAFNT